MIEGAENVAKYYGCSKETITSHVKPNDTIEFTGCGGSEDHPHLTRRRHTDSYRCTEQDAGIYTKPTRFAALGMALKHDQQDPKFEVTAVHRALVHPEHRPVYKGLADAMIELFKRYKGDSIGKTILKSLYTPLTGRMSKSDRAQAISVGPNQKPLTQWHSISKQVSPYLVACELLTNLRINVNDQCVASPRYRYVLDENGIPALRLVLAQEVVRKPLPHHLAMIRTAQHMSMLDRHGKLNDFALSTSHTDCIRGAQKISQGSPLLPDILAVEPEGCGRQTLRGDE